jgi:hypothetical protein
MKAQFIVTIEGSWLEGDKRATHSDAESMLREAVKDRFEFLAKRATVKKLSERAAEQAEVKP